MHRAEYVYRSDIERGALTSVNSSVTLEERLRCSHLLTAGKKDFATISGEASYPA
jgi:hypothetical protein